ncbi:hypothetical protein SH661x_000237 [Planctomicrobium sp. SH661]|uniref:hypothetical protein n=1 Tax=Planctomicrobium sp. SH661 TaxID=3448124 RepID=UPI003F5B8E9F
MTFARRIFRFAGIYGLIVLTPQYFGESVIVRQMPPAITHPEFFYGFLGVAIAWQLMFLIIAADPLRYRPAMLPAIVEKFSFGIATVVLFLQQRLSGQMLAGGVVDLLLGVLFVVAYAKTKPTAPGISD